jgi:hypothetical protein
MTEGHVRMAFGALTVGDGTHAIQSVPFRRL